MDFRILRLQNNIILVKYKVIDKKLTQALFTSDERNMNILSSLDNISLEDSALFVDFFAFCVDGTQVADLFLPVDTDAFWIS